MISLKPAGEVVEGPRWRLHVECCPLQTVVIWAGLCEARQPIAMLWGSEPHPVVFPCGRRAWGGGRFRFKARWLVRLRISHFFFQPLPGRTLDHPFPFRNISLHPFRKPAMFDMRYRERDMLGIGIAGVYDDKFFRSRKQMVTRKL